MVTPLNVSHDVRCWTRQCHQLTENIITLKLEYCFSNKLFLFWDMLHTYHLIWKVLKFIDHPSYTYKTLYRMMMKMAFEENLLLMWFCCEHCAICKNFLELGQYESILHVYFTGKYNVHLFWEGNYRNDPKFSDRYTWANSADPDQTAPRGAVWSGSTLPAIPSASFGLITLW